MIQSWLEFLRISEVKPSGCKTPAKVLNLLIKPEIRVLKKVTFCKCSRYEGAKESKQWRFFTQLFSLDARNIGKYFQVSRKISILICINEYYYVM